MRGSFETVRGEAVVDVRRRGRRAERNATMRERWDKPLGFILLCASVVFALLGFVGAVATNRAGWLDPPILEPVPDDRILTNLRDSTADYTGGAALGNGVGPHLLLRADGQLIQFDEPTGLIRTHNLDMMEIGLTTEVVGLSAGCGWQEPVPGAVSCLDPNAIFLRSADGGLIQGDTSNHWRTRLRDVPWEGLSGNPVEQEDVTAWASSENGRWVAVLAGSNGLALFDQQGDQWIVPPGQDRLVAAQDTGQVHLVPHQNRFWIGTVRGLAVIDVTEESLQLKWTDEEMRVVDLDVTPDNRTLTLVQGACEIGNDVDCLSIQERRSITEALTLVGERERIGDLSDVKMADAVLQGELVVTVSPSGVYSYSSARRTWQTIEKGEVDAHWTSAETGEILATFDNEYVKIYGGLVQDRRTVQGGPYSQIEKSKLGRVLGLDSTGQIRDLLENRMLTARTTHVPDETKFHTGAANGNQVLLAARNGILLHEVALRDFVWLPEAGLQGEIRKLLGNRVQLAAASNEFWLVQPELGDVGVISLGRNGRQVTVTVSDVVQSLTQPLKAVSGESTGLFLVDGNSKPWQLKSSSSGITSIEQVGKRRNGSGTLVAVAASGEELFFASRRQIWKYLLNERSWSGPYSVPESKEVSDLAVGDTVYLLSRDGQVLHGVDQGWRTRIGQGGLAALSSAEVTDARAFGRKVFLGGRGQVQAYDFGSGKFDPPLGTGQGQVRVIDVVEGTPIWQAGQKIYVEDRRLPDRNVRNALVLGAWPTGNGILALAEQPTGKRFAMYWASPVLAPRCWFRGMPTPQASVIDGVDLPGGRILIATINGARLFVESERRWLQVDGLPQGHDLRLHLSGQYLVGVTRNKLLATPLRNLPQPDNSCDSSTLRITWETDQSEANVAFDPQTSQVGLMSTNGSITAWSEGQFSEVLPPTSSHAPNRNSLQQVLQQGQHLVFAGRDRLWSYHLQRREWHDARLELPPGALRADEVDLISVGGGRLAVTVWTVTGETFTGLWHTDADRVQLARVHLPRLAPISVSAEQILDISVHNDTWAVGTTQGIQITRRGLEVPSGIIRLPTDQQVEPSPYQLKSNVVFVAGPDATPISIFILPANTQLSGLNESLENLSLTYRPRQDRGWGMSRIGDQLWRIDEHGVVYSCAIDAGASVPETCELALGPPIRIDPEQVQLVLADKTSGAPKYYALVSQQLALFQSNMRDRQYIIEPDPRDDAALLSWMNVNLLWDGHGGSVWMLEGDLAVHLVSNVTHVERRSDVVLLQTASELLVLNRDGTATPPRARHGGELLGATYDWGSGGPITGLDSSGFVWDDTSRQLFEARVPQPSTVRSIHANIEHKRIWVHRIDGRVEQLEDGSCRESASSLESLRPCFRQISNHHPTDLTGDRPLLSVLWQPSLVELRYQNATLVYRPGDAWNDLTHAPHFTEWRRPDRYEGDIQQFLDLIQERPDGVHELAPAYIDSQRSTLMNGSGGRLAELSPPPLRWSALSLDWLNWDRSRKQFSVKVAGDEWRIMPPTRMLRDEIFVLDHPGRGRVLPDGSAIQWVTPYSIWTLPALGFRHERSSTRSPYLNAMIDLPGEVPIGLNSGRFLFPDGQGVGLDELQVTSDVDSSQVRSDDLSLSYRWRDREVDGVILRSDGTNERAFSDRGFRHDERHSIGFDRNRLVVGTPVGLVNTDDLSNTVPLPAGQIPDVAITHEETLYAKTGERWHQFDLGTHFVWRETNNPQQQRVIRRREGVAWQVGNGGLDVTTSSPLHEWRASRQYLEFDRDQLIYLAATKQYIVVGTALGTHSIANASELSNIGPSRAPIPRDTMSFDALDVRPGQAVLFAQVSDSPPKVWNSSRGEWNEAKPGETPWRERLAVATGDLEISIKEGQLNYARHAVKDINGTRRMANFDWQAGDRMPFDRANAIHFQGRRLYVGTDAGLQIFDPGGHVDLVDWQQPFANEHAPANSVDRVGNPADSSRDHVYVRNESGNCIKYSVTRGQWLLCSQPVKFAEMVVHHESSNLWEWHKTRGGIEGTYILQGGGRLLITNDPVGYWPHDQLAAHISCRGTRVELWSDRKRLRDGTVTIDLGIGGWQKFLCRRQAVGLSAGQNLPAGLYLAGTNASTARFRDAPASWLPVPSSLRSAVQERAGGRWPYEAGRIRIRVAPLQQSYEHRLLDGAWKVMEWVGGLPAMDETRGFSIEGKFVDRLTPLGWVRHQLDVGSLRINPDTAVFRTTSQSEDLNQCQPERIERFDGRRHPYTFEAGAPLMVRCLSGKVWQLASTSVGIDVGAVQPVESDPFAHRVLIAESDGWSWDKIHENPASYPRVEIAFGDLPLSLSGGRFDRDDYHELATPFKGRLSVIAGSGWWRYPDNDLRLQSARQPNIVENPRALVGVTVDRDQDSGEVHLCLSSSERSFALNSEDVPRTVESCKEWRGGDRLYQYRMGRNGEPTALASASNGPQVKRQLKAGRFSDRIAQGDPIPLSLDGKLAIPTAASIVVLLEDGQSETILAYTDSATLVHMPSLGPVVVAASGVHSLSGQLEDSTEQCSGLNLALASVPADVRIHRVQSRGSDLFVLRGMGSSGVFRATARCDAKEILDVSVTIDVSDRVRHVAAMRTLPQSTRVIEPVQTVAGTLMLTDGYGRRVELISGVGQLLATLGPAQARRLVLVTEQEAYVLNIDAAISALARTQVQRPSVSSDDNASQQGEANSVGASPLPSKLQQTVPPSVPPNQEQPGDSTLPSTIPPADDRGHKGSQIEVERVKQMQNELRVRGWYTGSIDGLIGPLTKDAVQKYQHSIGAEPTGELSDEQFRRLLSGQ